MPPNETISPTAALRAVAQLVRLAQSGTGDHEIEHDLEDRTMRACVVGLLDTASPAYPQWREVGQALAVLITLPRTRWYA